MFSDVNNDAEILRELNHESKETKENDILHDELYERWSKKAQANDEQIIDVAAKMESDVKVEVVRIVFSYFEIFYAPKKSSKKFYFLQN